MAPGFDFADYEAARPEELRAEFPEWAGWIESLTGGR
jgi:predicted cupin superfamily sugar epimerase